MAIKDEGTRSWSLLKCTSRCGRTLTPGGYRVRILAEIDTPPQVGNDYVDPQQIHRFDYDIAFDETLEALHDVEGGEKAT
ncbi:MAG: hypothetical protein U0797_00740 [Gemmataceae bacterium]